MKYPNSYVVWDLETTGFSPKDCRILEVACLMVENGVEVGTYSSLLNYKVEIPEGAAKVHGITAEMCEMEGKDPKEVLLEVLAIFNKYDTHITHNGIKFDIPFMIESLIREDLHSEEVIQWLEHKALDTAAIIKGQKLYMKRWEDETFREYAKRVMDRRAFGVKYNLGLICDEMDISRRNITQHRAAADVFLTNEIYKKLNQ